MARQRRQTHPRELDRRQFLRMTATGLSGLIIVSCGTADQAVDDPAASPAAGDEPDTGAEPTAAATTPTLSLHTMGIGTTVLDPVLQQFEAETGIPTQGTQLAFGDMVPQWTQGGYETQWDTIEAQGAQIDPLVAAETLQPIKVADITHWDQLLPVFTEEGAEGQDGDGHPFTQIYTQAAIDSGDLDEVWVVPTVWNGDSIGYRTDLIDEELTSYSSLWDPKFRGQVALFNSPLRAPMEVLATLSRAGEYQVQGTIGNPTRDDIDVAIEFLLERKRDGQFRLLWDDFGQAVELLASGEVALMNAWEPIVREVVAQGKPAVYGRVEEGYNMWFHGIALSAASANYDAAVQFANFWHEGPAAAEVANQGYITPAPQVAMPVLDEADSPEEGTSAWEYWYAGQGRDRGTVEDIAANAAWWWQFPDESDYLTTRWQDFVAA